MAETRRTTSAERMTLHRHRKRLGLRPVTVIVSEQESDFLLAHDYELSRKDADSIRRAVSPLRFCAVPAGAARFRLMDCYLPRSLTYSTLTSPLTSKCMRVAVARVFKC
jgi:hypothetical protein